MVIPVQTRKKMLAAVERGESVAAVARRFEITEHGLHQLIKRCRERGTIEPLKPGPKGPTKLTTKDDTKMLALIKADPGMTLKQVASHLSAQVVESTVYRSLKRLGVSLKKVHDRPRTTAAGRRRASS